MIPLRTLREAVGAALRYLRGIPDIAEVEVFAASNAALLARLNYTSHIPCNGVEEPKSTSSYGLGLQAVFSTPEGKKIGFGSEPSDLTLDGVRRAIEKAREGAVLDPEFSSLPCPGREKRKLRRYHDPELMGIRDEDLVEAGWKVLHGALTTFSRSPRLATLAGHPENLPALGLIVGGDVTILQERVALASSHMPAVQTDESTLLMVYVTAMVETEDAKGTGSSAATHLTEFTDAAGGEAATNAINAIGGKRIPAGEYTVIFGRQPVADLLNNLVLPSLMASTFYGEASAFQGKMGQRVASPALTLLDDGATRGLVGSKGITCEGLPTGKTVLIKNGVLSGLLTSHYEATRLLRHPKAKEKLGTDPRECENALTPRNGFRFGAGGGRQFDTPPGISSTNAIVRGRGALPTEDLIRKVKNGLFIGRIWYTYPINGLRAGDFTCTVVGDSYIITEGKIVTPLKPNTVRINDNIHSILTKIIGIGRERRSTLVWAADEVVYTPEIAVKGVRVEEIAGYMETL